MTERRLVQILRRVVRQEPKRLPTSVYFVACFRCGLVKVGFSKDPGGRWASAAGEHCRATWEHAGGEMELVGYLDGHRGHERAIHEAFAPQRVYGEWFRVTDEQIAWIQLMCWAGAESRRLLGDD